MRRLCLVIFIAFVIQLPFLILMSFAGVHSALGGVWVVFYLPTMWLLDITRVPNFSPFADMLIAALFQEVILVILILSSLTLCLCLKSMIKKAA